MFFFTVAEFVSLSVVKGKMYYLYVLSDKMYYYYYRSVLSDYPPPHPPNIPEECILYSLDSMYKHLDLNSWCPRPAL